MCDQRSENFTFWQLLLAPGSALTKTHLVHKSSPPRRPTTGTHPPDCLCGLYRVRHKKQPPKKTHIFRERYNLNYSNLQHLLLRDIAQDSENLIHAFSRKQKIQLSKLKSAILQLNTCYYRNCYTENVNKTNYREFIWKDKCPLNSSDPISLDYPLWTAMLEMYQCYTPKPTNTYGTEERCESDLDWLASRPKLMQQYCRSTKGSTLGVQKAAIGHFEHAVLTDVTIINMSCFFTIIKTVSIYYNLTDQLLFTYIIALWLRAATVLFMDGIS